MRKITRLVVAILAAAIVVSLAAGPAAARVRIEARGGPNILAIARRLTFGGSEGVGIICDVTFHGTIQRLINKRRGEHLGSFTRDLINLETCRNSLGIGTTLADALTPCLIRYGTITGTLPNITGGTLLVDCGFLIEVNAGIFGESRCLYRQVIEGVATENPILRIAVAPNVVTLFRDLGGSRPCDPSGELAGLFDLVPLITLTLLER